MSRSNSCRPSLFIVGPTAAGKTEVSVLVAARVGGEIISCDSMQVYKGMEILTARPPARALSSVRHHLIGVIEPSQDFNVMMYVKMAGAAMEDVRKRGRTPVVCGGSGMYAKALLDGIADIPGPDGRLRQELADLAAEEGPEKFHRRLAEVDAQSANVIPAGNVRRVIRALEVHKLTGKRLSELKAASPWGSGGKDAVVVGIMAAREELYRRIDKRVDDMWERGVVEEVRQLLNMDPSGTARQTLGISQIEGFISGACGEEEAKERLKRDTRRYAKRQLTWFRGDPRVTWVESGKDCDARALCEKAVRIWKEQSSLSVK